MHTFNYIDEDDRCYGLTGMVLPMYERDVIDMLMQITLDNDEGNSIAFTPDFFFNSNPRYSAKLAWNEMLRQYDMLLRLVVGNIACRQLAYQHKPIDAKCRADVFDLVSQEGMEACSLEADEIKTLFDRTMHEMESMFGNPQVKDISRRFVDELKRRRTMSASEVAELIQYLVRH